MNRLSGWAHALRRAALAVALLAAAAPLFTQAAGFLDPDDYTSLAIAPPPLAPAIVFNTDAGTVTYRSLIAPPLGQDTVQHGVIVPQPGGRSIAVFTFDDFQQSLLSTIEVVGTRPLALLSKGNVTVTSIIDVSAVGQDAGSGGYDGGSEITSSGGSGTPLTYHPGSGPGGGQFDKSLFATAVTGGGGGFGGKGGNGVIFNANGNVTPGPAGIGGKAYGDLALVHEGGSGGGGGVRSTSLALSGDGGGGGGAIQIVAKGSVSVAGIAAAGGAADTGGGGAGGGVMLRGANIATPGGINASGGDTDTPLGGSGVAPTRGGGGGGGRVLLSIAEYDLALPPEVGTVDVSGGRGQAIGANGTAVLQADEAVVRAGAVVDLRAGESRQSQPRQTLKLTFGAFRIDAGGLGYAQGDYAPGLDITLAGGTLATPGRLMMGAGRRLAGQGTVAGGVQLAATATLHARGGQLALGDLARTNATRLDGHIVVDEDSALFIQQANAALLGNSTTLRDGARLGSFNGLVLGKQITLTATGDASIQGNFENQGLVVGPHGAGQSLTFLNDVAGAGDYAGSILFRAGFTPGNSPAVISFGGGDALFDTNAVLTMEIGGDPQSNHIDRLIDIALLGFNGRLHLAFVGGYTPQAGARYALFDFERFSGHLDADVIDVTGYDRRYLDFSRLAQDGSLRVVPLPATLWPFGLALAVLAHRRLAAAQSSMLL